MLDHKLVDIEGFQQVKMSLPVACDRGETVVRAGHRCLIALAVVSGDCKLQLGATELSQMQVFQYFMFLVWGHA